jgi:hypothetical protein
MAVAVAVVVVVVVAGVTIAVRIAFNATTLYMLSIDRVLGFGAAVEDDTVLRRGVRRSAR